MAQPVAYVPATSFVTYQATQPWFPGQNVDVELANLKTTTDQIRTNLALIQRDDGALANGSVGINQLTPAIAAAFNLTADTVVNSVIGLTGVVTKDALSTALTLSPLATSTDAAGLTGTVASARIVGAYTGITSVGTLTSLTANSGVITAATSFTFAQTWGLAGPSYIATRIDIVDSDPTNAAQAENFLLIGTINATKLFSLGNDYTQATSGNQSGVLKLHHSGGLHTALRQGAAGLQVVTFDSLAHDATFTFLTNGIGVAELFGTASSVNRFLIGTDGELSFELSGASQFEFEALSGYTGIAHTNAFVGFEVGSALGHMAVFSNAGQVVQIVPPLGAQTLTAGVDAFRGYYGTAITFLHDYLGNLSILNGPSVASESIDLRWGTGSGDVLNRAYIGSAQTFGGTARDLALTVGGVDAVVFTKTTLVATFAGKLAFSGTTNQGLVVNSLTTTQVNALTPSAGNIVYDSTLTRFKFYDGGAYHSHTRLDGDTMTGTLVISAATSCLDLGANSGNLGIARLFGSTSGSVTLKPAAAAGTGTIFQLPATNGSSGQFLQTNGSGVTSWASSGGTFGLVGSAMAVDFNSVADTAITITLPAGYTRYRIQLVQVHAVSGAWGTGTVALYTGAGATGVTLNGPTTLSTLTNGDNAGNTIGSVSGVSNGTTSLTLTTLYLRVTIAQGAASVGDVFIYAYIFP